RMADGLNTITRRGEIGTSFPVFGLRPSRCPFLRTTKDPNDESLTVSPRSRQSVISFNTNSTNDADSVRDSPTFWYTASHRSARVTVFPPIAKPRYRRSTPLTHRRYEQRATGSTGQCVFVVIWRLLFHQGRAPGEPAPHRLEQHEVARLDASVADRHRQREGNRGRRGVAVPVDRRDHLLGRDPQLVRGTVDDPLVGLMRDEPVDVVGGVAGRLEGILDDIGNHGDS